VQRKDGGLSRIMFYFREEQIKNKRREKPDLIRQGKFDMEDSTTMLQDRQPSRDGTI
jgi:hypothetical protein